MTESTHFRRVLDLVDQDVSGRVAQVRTHYNWSDWQPMWRVLKSVAIGKNDMVYLWWIPEHDTGSFDCGYSGRGIELANDWEIEMEDTSGQVHDA